eukprot:13894506-Alexandrium_andersonii.AAC.1
MIPTTLERAHSPGTLHKSQHSFKRAATLPPPAPGATSAAPPACPRAPAPCSSLSFPARPPAHTC